MAGALTQATWLLASTGNRASFSATSKATTSRLLMNIPMPFQPA